MEPIIAPKRRGTTKRSTTRKRSTTTRRAAPRTPEHPAPSKGERVFLLDVEYEERAIAQHFGARYFSSEGWAYTGTTLPPDLERYRPQRYSWQEWQERTLMGEITATTPAPAPDPDPSTGSMTLRQDQLQDVKKLIVARQAGAPEVLNGSGVGVGKTPVAISAIKRMAHVKNVLVVCPLPVAAGWRLHLRDMGDGGMNWCIINYESTKKLLEPPAAAKAAKKTRTKNLHTVQSGKPKVQWDVVIVDESHYCFPGDTLVSTEDGPVEIAELVARHGSGDPLPNVLSQSRDGSLRFQKITGVFISPPAPLVRVRHARGEVVCTEDHPLHSKEHGYAPASLLQEGGTLTVALGEEGKGVGESIVRGVEPMRQGTEPTFNLSVETNENYFANGVLAHNCSNPESQRTRAIDKIVAGPGHRPAFKINMSATAGKDPAKISYLHRGLFWTDGLQPLPHIDSERFIEWCEAHRLSVRKDSFGNALKWDPAANGSNPDRELERLHSLLFKTDPVWAFRRMPDWPEQRRIPAPVELTWAEMEAYNADWKEFQQELAAIERKLKSPKTTGKAKSAMRAKGLGAQTRFRQKAGQVRASGTASFAAEMVRKGHQVAISAEYLGTVNRLHEELTRLKVPTALFTGENRAVREDERVAYQRGEKQVIIYTPTEGFNLHAGETAVGGNNVPRVTVVAEPRWSPGKALQAEGRGHRNGTDAPVYYTFASGTVEENVIHRCIDGMRNIGKINGDDTKPFEGLKEALGVPIVFAA